MGLRRYTSVSDRRRALEKELKISLLHTGSFTLDESVASTRHCENMIGATQVPLGIAGPIEIKTTQGKAQKYFVPLATTEGALVASVNRGCKALSESGGATVDGYLVGATRGAVFAVANLRESDRLNAYLQTHVPDLAKAAAKTSKHITLTSIFTRGVGRQRYVRFVYDTQDAMGMNMVTIATSSIVQIIESSTGATCVSVAGNYDVDKKPAWLNVIEGRGRKAWAEAVIPEPVLRNTLKTTAQKVFDVWLTKCMIGSAMSGSMSFNAHYANIIAAIFLATGQDPAHIVEGSLGITTCESIDKDLYVSIYLPDLMIGTVGGGTGLATQKEALSIIGAKTAEECAHVVAGAVLAGELSLLASLSQGTLASAHQKLARGESHDK